MPVNLNQYVEQLREHAARSRAEHERQQAAKRLTQSKLNYPETVRAWWNAQPPCTHQHPWQLKTIAAAAFASNPRKPSIQHVAEVLRQLGFTEHRDWTAAGRNRRYWLAPTN